MPGRKPQPINLIFISDNPGHRKIPKTAKNIVKNQFLFFLALAIISLFASLPVSAETPSAQSSDTKEKLETPQNIMSGIANQMIDGENLEKLKNLSPDKITELDKKIDSALQLYNQRKFGQALSLFKDVSNEIETISIMWWIGTSAMNVGELNLAAEKFQKILTINPAMVRVRLELSSVHFQLGGYEEARKELEIVKASKPPDVVLKNIDQLLAAITEREKKIFTNVQFSQGIMWDSNINGGPANRELSVLGGTITLNDESMKLSDWASVTSLSGNVLYDTKKWGLMWNTSADLYYKGYFKYNKFNSAVMDISTGPWWVGRNDIIKVPMGYSEKGYGDNRLSNVLHIDPSYEHFFSQYFGIRGQYSYAKENFYSENITDLNNITRSYEIAPSIYLFNRKSIISFSAGYISSDADARYYTYTAPYYGISYFLKFPTKTEFFAKYQWMDKNYKEAPLLYDDERVDRQQSITAVLSQELWKYYFVSLAFTYVNNKSNAELYTYDQMTCMFNVGFKF